VVVTSLLARKEKCLNVKGLHYLNEVGIVRQGVGVERKRKGERE